MTASRAATLLQYECALEALVARGLHASKRAMLLAHLAAPGRTISMRKLAALVGYRNFNAANLHYGRLGGEIARYGHFEFPDRRFAISSIGSWVGVAKDENDEFQFTMHPELAEAVVKVLGVGEGKRGQRRVRARRR